MSKRRAVRNGHGVEIDLALCSACRSCELACSFRRVGAYSPSDAAIQITYDAHTGGVTARFRASCDGCAGVSEGPRCVRYCPLGAAHRIARS